MNQLVPTLRANVLPALVTAASERASLCFLEFFASNIRNAHTRRAYAHAASDFLAWCEAVRVRKLAAVQPLRVAAWVEGQGRTLAAPSVKQRLSAVRHLFDGLVVGRVVATSQAASGRW